MDQDATIVLGRLFWRVKEKIVETYKNLGERMPDDDLISQTLVTLYEQGCIHPAQLRTPSSLGCDLSAKRAAIKFQNHGQPGLRLVGKPRPIRARQT